MMLAIGRSSGFIACSIGVFGVGDSRQYFSRPEKAKNFPHMSLLRNSKTAFD